VLTRIAITNVALIARLELDFAAHFTALTGETGAGKSLLLDALGLALGARADAGLIRHGEAQAEVTALFMPAPTPELQALLDEQGIEWTEGEELILRRQIRRAEGKDGVSGKAWVNGTPVPATVLAQIGACLVDIHGQHGQQSLLNPANQRDVLDAMAGHAPLLAQTAATFTAWKSAQAKADALDAQLAEARENTETLNRLRKDLETVAYEPGEEETLTQSRHRLMHAAQLQQYLTGADDALSNMQQGAVLGLKNAVKAVALASGVDESLTPLAARLESLNLDLADAAHDVARALSSLEAEGNLESIEDRLHALKSAARKAGCDIPELPAVLERVTQQTSNLGLLEGELLDARRDAKAARQAFESACQALTAARSQAAKQVVEHIQKALKDLLLPHATLDVALTPLPSTQWNQNGAESLEILLAANPGNPAQPMAKVASGGELSRLMLAVKTVMYQGLPAQTVVFDEIDTGLSGAASSAVGRAMAKLGQAHQVLAVTHHPQVAACAAQHIRIGKRVENGTTTTYLEDLSETTRPEELARLLSGAHITDEARAAAHALLAEGRSLQHQGAR
jgi:DNA repair protein RecN (Recombination protein N)